VSSPEPDDPFESINRPIFYFNDFIYRYSLIPLANGYDYIVPAGLDESFGNFFNNLREPLYAVNHLLQGEFRNFARNMTRFLVNTGLGFLGFFDTASPLLEIKKTPTTLSDTLAAYGVGQGPYLVLPILGSTTLRGTVTYPEDYFAHPARFYKDQKVATGLLIAEGVRKQIPQLLDYQDALEESQDPYRFVRNLYLQNLDRDESYEK
jgi:phospholipid-binding lipoprotein MlaA